MRQTDRQTVSQADIHSDKHRHTHIHTADIQTGRRAYIHTYIQADIHTK